MSDWRYWITRSGIVKADSEEEARALAIDDERSRFGETEEVEVEEVGEGE